VEIDVHTELRWNLPFLGKRGKTFTGGEFR
jgi:hypothetical protein